MTREEVNQTLNELCQYGGMMLGERYVEAIKIAASFYETGKDTAMKDGEKDFAESIIALIPHLPTESDKARIQTAMKEGGQMRDATKEERESVDNYIKSISQKMITIPNKATNGDIIKALFPNGAAIMSYPPNKVGFITKDGNPDDNYVWYPTDWWNAPYKGRK